MPDDQPGDPGQQLDDLDGQDDAERGAVDRDRQRGIANGSGL
jgi:hypothetical protein